LINLEQNEEEEMIQGVGHIGIVVKDLEVALAKFCKGLNLTKPNIKDVADRQMKVAVLDMGNVSLEFIEDYSATGMFARIVQERGTTIHHVALLTDDIDADLVAIEGRSGDKADKTPRVGLRGKRIVFLGPEQLGNINVELTEP
jgi:methylmalonyl-CoA/ethylmalonyl-CoA epimerase